MLRYQNLYLIPWPFMCILRWLGSIFYARYLCIDEWWIYAYLFFSLSSHCTSFLAFWDMDILYTFCIIFFGIDPCFLIYIYLLDMDYSVSNFPSSYLGLPLVSFLVYFDFLKRHLVLLEDFWVYPNESFVCLKEAKFFLSC